MQYPNQYWNGYYTSRPNFKELSRDLTYNAYQSLSFYSYFLIKDLDARKSVKEFSTTLQDKLSNIQHHDTITGTSR